MEMDGSQFRTLFSEEESDATVSKLKALLKARNHDVHFQEELLSQISKEKRRFFKSVLNWGSTQKDQKSLWGLVTLLLEKDKGRRPSQVANGFHLNSEHPDPRREGRGQTLLARAVRAKTSDLIKLRGLSDENILHAACQCGTSESLETIIEEISKKKNISALLVLAQEARPVIGSKKAHTPLEVAIDQGSVDMIKILANYEDGFLTNHFYVAATQGNLEHLQALISGAGKDVVGSILTPELLKAAIDKKTTRPHRRYFDIWDLIILNKKELGNVPGMLELAIENGHSDIVKSLLDNYKSHLTTSLDRVSVAAQLAVDLLSKSINAKKEFEDRLAEKQNIIIKRSPREEPLTTLDSVNTGKETQKPGKISDNDNESSDETDDSTSEEDSDEEQDDTRSENLADLERTILEATEIRDVLMDRMVRTLSPRDVRACWPKERDEPVREVCLELNVTGGQDWTWFVQFVKTAKTEVDEVEAKIKIARSGQVLATHDKQEEGDSFDLGEETSLPISHRETSTDAESFPEGNEDTPKSSASGAPPDIPLPTPKIKSSYRPEFQPYLKFVSFPDLDSIRGHQCAEPIRDILGQEVLYVIKWLQMVKGVKKVMKLKVLDSRYEPHKEEVIEDCIRDLNIEELDWRRTDLSIESIKSASPGVQTIHLYSSGDWTPLLHWMSVDGLNRLEHAKKVNITILNDRVSEARTKDQIAKISTWSETEWVHRRTGSDTTPPFAVTAGAWGADGPIENPTRTSTRFARTVMQLEDFVSLYQGVRRRRVERAKRYNSVNVPGPVKVAIIDTGINQNSFDLQKYNELNCRGEMFSETQDSHWWLSADSHGTQMAKLVTAIDPHCELYIAKVGDHKTDITRGAVSRAIRGAIAEGADVISMSFALEPGDSQSMSELEKAIQAAAHKGIVMVCSTADEGENKPDALPAIYKETISIAACGSTGKPVDESNTTNVNFFFQGEDILHETFSSTASASSMTGSALSATTSSGGDHHRGQSGASSIERISGSSVATAIAAGVASLFLACCRLDGLTFDDTRRLKRVRKIFKAMTGTTIEQQNAKYVRPALVFETNGKGGNTPLIDPVKYHHLIVPQVEPTEDE